MKVVGRRSLLLGILCIILYHFVGYIWYIRIVSYSATQTLGHIGTGKSSASPSMSWPRHKDMETESKDHTQWIYGFYQGNSNRFGETMGIGSRHICVNMFLACVFFEVLCFNRCHLSWVCVTEIPHSHPLVHHDCSICVLFKLPFWLVNPLLYQPHPYPSLVIPPIFSNSLAFQLPQ